MKLLKVLLLQISLIVGHGSILDSHVQELFEDWRASFSVVYDDTVELTRRMKIWAQNHGK
jgi:hypothetical protein